MTLRFLLFFLFAGLSTLAENITILGINDIHAAVEQMPKLYTAVQQERAAAPISSPTSSWPRASASSRRSTTPPPGELT